MIQSLKRLAPLALVVLMLPSCASILNGKFQTVPIATNDSGTEVYHNDELVGTGNSLEVPLQRDLDTHQFRVELDGYKPEYCVAFQEKKSGLYVFSVIPFGILFYPIFYDALPKAFNYNSDGYSLEVQRPITTRAEDERYIFLNNTALEVDKENLVFSNISWTNYQNGNDKRMRSVESSEDINLVDMVFSDDLNELLTENQYSDTTETIFKNNTNTLYLSATITELEFLAVYHVKGNVYAGNFLEATMTTKWELQNVYEQVIYSTEIESQSGQFSGDFYDDAWSESMGDALTNSFLDFLDDPGVAEHKKMSEFDDINELDEIVVAKPTKKIESLTDAMESTVTIILDEGHGSGCIVSSDGYIVTNYHVTAGASDKLTVRLNNGEELEATFIRGNEQHDLALIKVDKTFDVAYELPTASRVDLGDEIFAIGTPTSIELGNSLSKGVLSGVREKDGMEFLQTDVSISPGNSGGALVSKEGRIVGVVNSKLIGFGVEGIAFGTPGENVLGHLRIKY